MILPEPTTKAGEIKSRVAEEARFFRGWLQSPLRTGAVSSSSRTLGRAMADRVPAEAWRDGVVLELGPGTGAVTQCLIERGVPPERLVLVEYSPEFCALLRKRFPGVAVLQGDAYRPGERLDKLLGGRRPGAVVSSLPLFTRPDEDRERVIGTALERMAPGCPFIQFSYGLTLPVKPAKVGAMVETSNWIKLNLPPARVLVYRRT